MNGIVFAHGCPLCKATPGQPCASTWTGQPYRWPHVERIQSVTR